MPLSALQRLSIARKEASRTSPAPPSPAPTSAPAAPSTPDGKPMSKLALLAQKRREEAQARASPGPATPTNEASQAVAPATSASEPASKPLSKLAQKMAAARAAKTETIAKEVPAASNAPVEEAADAMDVDETPGAGPSSLFSSAPRTSSRPSTFFSILTKPRPGSSSTAPPSEPTTSTSLHLPYVHDSAELDRRVQAAFGPGVESPDDIVLKARGGRAGTTAANGENGDIPLVKPKPVKAPAGTEVKNVPSEATKAKATTEESAKPAVQNGHAKKSSARKPRQGSQSTAISEKPPSRANGPSATSTREPKAPSRSQGTNPSAGDRHTAAPPPRSRAVPGDRPTKPAPDASRNQSATTPSTSAPKAASQAQSVGQAKPRMPRPPSDRPKLPSIPTGADGGEPLRAPPKAKPKPKSKVVQGPP